MITIVAKKQTNTHEGAVITRTRTKGVNTFWKKKTKRTVYEPLVVDTDVPTNDELLIERENISYFLIYFSYINLSRALVASFLCPRMWNNSSFFTRTFLAAAPCPSFPAAAAATSHY